ncbi:MAG: glycoside hydrolase family 1 protein [Myxococcales bacterium]|nr:glycoside hydrolase family 1 protein [Myxococcales bacterium]
MRERDLMVLVAVVGIARATAQGAVVSRMLLLLLLACDPDPGDPLVYAFPEGFRWGAAGAAHQIEGGNTNNNWFQFETLPEFDGKTAEPSGAAVDGYARYEDDADLLVELGADIYRLSIEWSRVEPQRDVWDEAQWQHYRDVLETLRARGIEPMVTLHHFTEPIWMQDLADLDCAAGPTDANLCGWTNPAVPEEFAEFAGEAAARFGDLVDEWSTFNEPGGYLLSGYLGGAFPPGELNITVTGVTERVIPVAVGMLDGHAGAYAAVHAADVADADGNGVAASVGFTNSIQWIVPVDEADADDVAAADRIRALYGYIFSDGVISGLLDRDLDGTPEEAHPEWANTCDRLGYQYYFRMYVKALPGFPPIDAVPCEASTLEILGMDPSTFGCPTPHPDDVTQMGYEHYAPGLGLLAPALAERYPGTPLRVTEAGIGTTTGRRRAENIVRQLAGLADAIDAGAPVDGYIHWSLTDNFEWAEGFRPRFGLWSVDLDTFARTPTEGADVLRGIIADNGIRQSVWEQYGQGDHLSPGE